MKAKFHINPETGRPGECTASIKDCKYAKDGMLPEHYDSLDDALDAYEEANADKAVSTLKKTVKNDSPEDSEVIIEVDENNSSTLDLDDDMGIEDAEIVEETHSQKVSAPKVSAPVEYQAASAIEIVEPKKALTLVDDLSSQKKAAIDKRSSEWLDKITSINPNSQDFEEHTKAISNIASKAFSSTAALSTNFLNNTSSRKNSASDKVGKALSDVRSVVEDMSPKEDTFKEKALSFLPGRNAIKNYFNRFESNAKQLDVIMQSLNKGQASLAQENAELQVERKVLWNDLTKLQEAEGLLSSMDDKVVEKINEEKANGNAEMVKGLEQNVLFNIRQRRQDVATQTAVTIQSYMAMGMIETNNDKLAQNVERTKTTTATALATSARIADSLGHQKKILDGVEFMRNKTNDLITSNANQMQQNALQIQKQSTTSSVDPKVLNDTFNTMFETLDQMDNFTNEANQNFLTTINALGEQVNRANQYARNRNEKITNQVSGQEKLELEI